MDISSQTPLRVAGFTGYAVPKCPSRRWLDQIGFLSAQRPDFQMNAGDQASDKNTCFMLLQMGNDFNAKLSAIIIELVF